MTGDRYVSIGVRVPGRIDRCFVEEGQSVRKGDALVQIDDREYRAAVARAEANLELVRANLGLAEADLARGTTLQEGGVISKQEFDVFRNKADLNRVHMGQPAEVTPDAYPDAHYPAEVVKLYPQVDRQKVAKPLCSVTRRCATARG